MEDMVSDMICLLEKAEVKSTICVGYVFHVCLFSQVPHSLCFFSATIGVLKYATKPAVLGRTYSKP